MTARVSGAQVAFKRSIVFSVILHGLVFAVIIASPVLPSFSKKGMVHYVNIYSMPGGGGPGGGSGGGSEGSGGGGAKLQTTPLPAKKESLRDLTVLQKAKAEAPASMRYPVEKPKKDRKSTPDKKSVISKPQPAASPTEQAQEGRAGAGTGTGTGSGLRIGVGDGPGGDGFGFGYGSGGVSGFPYNYYLQVIMDRVSVNWYTGLVDPGVAGSFQAVVYFKIHRNGQVSELKVESSSGIQSLDMSALRAIQNSAPFPPLPNDYDDQYLIIHLIFEHSK